MGNDFITPIQPMQFGKENAIGQTTKTDAGSSVFRSIFEDAVNDVKTTQQDLEDKQYLLATGQLDNPAALTIASTKNEIAVSLLVQLRNKALDAYSELTRISL